MPSPIKSCHITWQCTVRNQLQIILWCIHVRSSYWVKKKLNKQCIAFTWNMLWLERIIYMLESIFSFLNSFTYPARQTAILGEILSIFRSFYPYFLPMVPHPPFLSPLYGTFKNFWKRIFACLRNLPISAYFHLFSAYFPPKMVPHPCCKLKHGTHLLFFCPHVYGFCLFSANFLPIFRLTFRPYCRVAGWMIIVVRRIIKLSAIQYRRYLFNKTSKSTILCF